MRPLSRAPNRCATRSSSRSRIARRARLSRRRLSTFCGLPAQRMRSRGRVPTLRAPPRGSWRASHSAPSGWSLVPTRSSELRFGVGDFSGQRPPESSVAHAQLYVELLEQAGIVEEGGLDSMWISEHHFAEDGYMPAVLPIAAALVARTKRIVVGTDRLATSLHSAVRLAEDAVSLDLLSGGRFVLGLSLCYRDEEFAGFGVDPATDGRHLEDLAQFLRDAFRHISPPPYSPDGPMLMIAADGDEGADRAARLADILMVDPTEP